jgi:DNA-binding GntR family transcriptional regulator
MEVIQSGNLGNLREQVLDQVRSEIVSGRTSPGAVYSVPSLSQELGVSTTPVREALLELTRSGLLVAMRNRGFRVAALSSDALNDLFTMRDLMERYALETLARQGVKDSAKLTMLADRVADAVQKSDVSAYLLTDRAFHSELVGQVGNPLLTKMVLQLRDDMRLYGIESPEGLKRQKASVKEHYQLIDLAERQEIEKGGALMSQHILSWKPLFEKALAKLA